MHVYLLDTSLTFCNGCSKKKLIDYCVNCRDLFVRSPEQLESEVSDSKVYLLCVVPQVHGKCHLGPAGVQTSIMLSIGKPGVLQTLGILRALFIYPGEDI